MRPSKNSDCNKNNGNNSIDNFISFCVDESIKLCLNGGGNLGDVDDRICEVYDFNKEAAMRMYSPTFHYLTCDMKSKIIDCDCSLKETIWRASEKAKNLGEKDREKIIQDIKKENFDYFDAIIKKFSLNILLQ